MSAYEPLADIPLSNLVLQVAFGRLAAAAMRSTSYSRATTRRVPHTAVSVWGRRMRLQVNGLNSTGF
jgi:hypothetical protein